MTKEIHVKDFNHFQELVIEWADKRDMFSDNNTTVSFQLLKLIEQMGELGDALIDNDKKSVKNKVGICCVILVIIGKLGDCQVDLSDDVYLKRYSSVCESFGGLVQSFLDPVQNKKWNMFNSLVDLRGLAAREFWEKGDDDEAKTRKFLDCCQCAYNEINAYRIRGGAK